MASPLQLSFKLNILIQFVSFLNRQNNNVVIITFHFLSLFYLFFTLRTIFVCIEKSGPSLIYIFHLHFPSLGWVGNGAGKGGVWVGVRESLKWNFAGTGLDMYNIISYKHCAAFRVSLGPHAYHLNNHTFICLVCVFCYLLNQKVCERTITNK